MRKSVSLQWSRISQYYKNNPFIFVLFLFSSIVCTTGFIYLYGNYTTSMLIRNDESQTWRQYTINFNQPLYTYEQALGKISDIPFSSENSTVFSYQIGDDGTTMDIATALTGTPSIIRVSGRTEFTNEEMSSGEKVMILPHFFPKRPEGLSEDGKTFRFGAETFQIIGRHVDQECYIPPQTFVNLQYDITSIKVTAQKRPDNIEEDLSNQQVLQSIFPEADIRSTYKYYEAMEQSFPIELTMICLVYGLSMFSFMFLMKYMMETSIRENIIYGFVGASKNKITALLLTDNICFSVFTGAVGILLHVLLKEPLFDRVSVTENITYTAGDYLLIFVLSVVIAQLTLLPFLIGFRRHSLQSVKSRYSYT